MDNKKYYSPPQVVPYPEGKVPAFIEQLFLDDFITSSETDHVAPACTTVIDSDRKYVQVSNSFCELLGYKSEELVGKRCDEITAPRTSDIPTMFRPVQEARVHAGHVDTSSSDRQADFDSLRIVASTRLQY